MSLFEHPRRDLSILIAGCVMFVAALMLFPRMHPYASLGPQIERDDIRVRAEAILDDLGYGQRRVKGLPDLTVRERLLDSLQIHPQSDLSAAFHWRVLISGDTDDDSTSYFLNLEDTDQRRTTLELDNAGRLLAFRNPSQIVPDARAAAGPGLAGADATGPNGADAAGDVPATFAIAGPGGDMLPLADTLIAHRAEQLARDLLSKTTWAGTPLSLERIEPVSYGALPAARLAFAAPAPTPGTSLSVNIDISVDGALLSLDPDYAFSGGSPEDDAIIWIAIRGGAGVLFLIWLLYMLYVRVRERVIDVKSSIVFAVLIGFTFPLVNVSVLYELIRSGEVTFQLVDYLIQLVNLGISTAIISVAFFIVSAIGESVTRQYWSEKLQMLDFIRIGAIFSRPVGWMFIRAVMFGMMLLGLFSIAMWTSPGLFLKLPEQIPSHEYYLSFLASPLQTALFTLILTQSVFLVAVNIIRSKIRSSIALVTITSLLYAVLNLSILPVGPYAGQFLLNLGIGAILGAVYVRWDFLSAAIAQFLFIFGLTALAAWSAPGSGEVWMFVSFAVLSLALLVLGFSAALNGKDPSELGRYEPDYIEDLAMEQRMRQELTIAKQVQESFLPIRLPSFGRADIYARCRSAYETGGDYYDFFPLADRRLGVIIGDVSGKGIQAAFFMTFIKGVLHALAGSHDSTKDVLWNANALFQRNAPKGTFITLIYGILDLDVMEFRFTRAGHNPLILIRPSNGSIEEIRSEGLGVGMSNQSDFAKHTHEQHLAVSSGDLLVLYTDGIVEAMNEKGEPYGEEALKSMLIRNAGESSKEITARVFEDVQRFTSDAKQHDDMTMVVIRVP